MIVHHPRLFRRDAWNEVGGHDEKLTNAVDYDLFLKLSELGTMYHVREQLYSYRILQTSTSRAKADIQTENTRIVLRNALRRQGLDDFVVHAPNKDHPRRLQLIHQSFLNTKEAGSEVA